ncbi:MAG: signal peptide peptidase SppA [Dehalococcoidia bacterium]
MNGVLSTLMPKLPLGGPRIAVVEMYGAMGPAIRGPEYVRTLSALAQDPRIRSVVIDVDSPGGAAPVADQIYRSLRHLSARKPTVAFIRGAGLSGGYLVACGARKVVALPTALVGSIGVILMRPVVQELMQRIGVQMIVTKEGHLKDMLQPFRPPTDEEQAKLQELTGELYEWFVDAVATSRKLDPETVRGYATGEMYTATKGKAMGLIDELGDWDTALDMASEMGRTPRRLQYVRPRRPLLERVLARGGASMAGAALAELESRLSPRLELR